MERQVHSEREARGDAELAGVFQIVVCRPNIRVVIDATDVVVRIRQIGAKYCHGDRSARRCPFDTSIEQVVAWQEQGIRVSWSTVLVTLVAPVRRKRQVAYQKKLQAYGLRPSMSGKEGIVGDRYTHWWF